MRFLLFISLLFVHKYDHVLTSHDGRTIYVSYEGGYHVYKDTLNIKVFYSDKRVTIQQRDHTRIYKKSDNPERDEVLYFMHPACETIPNAIFTWYKEESSELYIRYYYITNTRGTFVSKTEVYNNIKKEPYRFQKLPNRNKRCRQSLTKCWGS